MHKLITNFRTYDKILKNYRLKRDLKKAIIYITQTDIGPFVNKNQKNLIVLPISIRSIPITVLNKICNDRLAEYDDTLKIITLGYNFYNAHSATDLLGTLVHEYGHAYLYNKKIQKLTMKDFYDQHEFFCQMLSLFYSCRIFLAKRNALYLWCNTKNLIEKRRIESMNDLPQMYHKKYWYKYMIKLCKAFLRAYPPDKQYKQVVKGNF